MLFIPVLLASFQPDLVPGLGMSEPMELNRRLVYLASYRIRQLKSELFLTVKTVHVIKIVKLFCIV